MMNKKSVIKEESYRNFKNLSHELKTPVANLNLVLETLYEYDKTISIDKKKEIISNSMNTYQWQVYDNISKYLKNEKTTLTTGKQALNILRGINSIIKQIGKND